MALIIKGNATRLERQKGWTISEEEDNTLRSSIIYRGDQSLFYQAPRLKSQIHTGENLFCYARQRAYEGLRLIGIQCDYIGIDRDPTEPKIEYAGASGQEPIEAHPNFSIFAGTPANPRNGAVFGDDGRFVGFGNSDLAGTDSYIGPSVRVDRNYWTFHVPQGRRICKEIATALPGVPFNPMSLNYLLIGLPYRQFGLVYQVTEQWLGSGPRGWNRKVY